MNLTIEHLNKAFFNENQPHVVLADVNFKVREGEFVTLLGPSGCGKTTLLTIIAGFQSSSGGAVLLNGNRVIKPGPDRGFVFQNYALFPWMTVRDNILYPMKRRRIPKDQMKKRLQELLVMAQLEGKERLYPQQLSGGMKQRTAFIRALAGNPAVLLMDEPLGAVDFQMRQILQEELEALWLKDRTTVLMVTHDVDEAIYLSDRIIVMSAHQGDIMDILTIKLSRPRNRNDKQYTKYKEHLMDLLRKALNKESSGDRELEGSINLCLAR